MALLEASALFAAYGGEDTVRRRLVGGGGDAATRLDATLADAIDTASAEALAYLRARYPPADDWTPTTCPADIADKVVAMAWYFSRRAIFDTVDETSAHDLAEARKWLDKVARYEIHPDVPAPPATTPTPPSSARLPVANLGPSDRVFTDKLWS